MRRLDEIKHRLDRTTPRPWQSHAFGYPGEEEPSSIVIFHGEFDWYAIRHGEADVVASTSPDNPSDADLIANAPEDLALLVDTIEQLEAEMDRLDNLAYFGVGYDSGVSSTVSKLRDILKANLGD